MPTRCGSASAALGLRWDEEGATLEQPRVVVASARSLTAERKKAPEVEAGGTLANLATTLAFHQRCAKDMSLGAEEMQQELITDLSDTLKTILHI
ncbi:hypothetical protein CYMTET_56278 [Cymbomonas tetramitiformis]|uniref:Uncharacterized protein n=1 Tax=Cymbomonas tetramitiformis TaxID=36881 RepID=A0AAE0BBL8_9CHLO|nr:hypothetical protein CYMTET_56278 [Cymbomonas tetramitiformis]